MSDDLKQFYREIWAWIQSDFPDHETFRRDSALCSSLMAWGRMNNADASELIREQSKIFSSLSGCSSWPFNRGGDHWVYENDYGDFYRNQKRLAFIEERAK